MNLFALSSLLCGVFSLVLAFFSLFAGKSKAYRLLFYFYMACVLWGLGCYLAATAETPQSGLMGWKVAHVGGFFIATLFYHLVLSVCELQKTRTLIFGYSQGIFFLFLSVTTTGVFRGAYLSDSGYYASPAFLYYAAVLIHFYLVLLSYKLLLGQLREVDGIARIQIQLLLIGFLFGFVGGTSVLLPIFGVSHLYPVGNIGIFISAAIISFAILHTKALELETITLAAHRERLAAVGTMATSINHEIRNPLYVIQGLAESHVANVHDGTYRNDETALNRATEILTKTAEQSKRAMEIMRRFSVFAKQRITQKPTPESLRLDDTLKTIMPLIEHEIESDKIKLNQTIPDDLPNIQADRHHLEQILINLIVNSCQAMKDTGGIIEIAAAQQNGHINVEVKDTGPGIPAGKLSDIFKPFYSTKAEKGTGLGLYITKQLVERNGGSIAVKSKEGKGTTFVLRFKR